MLTIPGRSGTHRRAGRWTNRGPRLLRAGVLAAGMLILVTACTTSAADGPTTTPMATITGTPSAIDPSSLLPSTSAPPASPSPSPSPSDPGTSVVTTASPDISPQEAADRAAIEAQWAEFWRVYTNIIRTPVDQRSTALDAVSVDPAKSNVLGAASRLEADGLDYYGSVVLRPFSVEIDSSRGVAVLEDCQDQSGYGSLYVETGKKRTVGVSDNNTQAGFVRGTDGVWRVQNVQYPTNVPC